MSSTTARIQLLEIQSQPIRSLPEFQKHHRVPTAVTENDRRFVNGLVQSQLEADLESIYKSLRKSFAMKRKEIVVEGPADGGGVIRLPFFQYFVMVEQDPESPDKLLWRRGIADITEPARIIAPPFAEVFQNRFSVVEIDLETALDLEAVVDHIEEEESPGTELDYDMELTWCRIDWPGLKASVLLQGCQLQLTSRQDRTTHEMMNLLLELQSELADALGNFVDLDADA